jgi:hypothetical protein
VTGTMRSESGGRNVFFLTLEAGLMSAFRSAWGAWIARRLLWRWRIRPATRHGRSERSGYRRLGSTAAVRAGCLATAGLGSVWLFGAPLRAQVICYS